VSNVAEVRQFLASPNRTDDDTPPEPRQLPVDSDRPSSAFINAAEPSDYLLGRASRLNALPLSDRTSIFWGAGLSALPDELISNERPSAPPASRPAALQPLVQSAFNHWSLLERLAVRHHRGKLQSSEIPEST
jgi:hypothetical protein